jgi:hypothetical protein
MLEAFILHIDKFIAISLSFMVLAGLIYFIEQEVSDESLEASGPEFPPFNKS